MAAAEQCQMEEEAEREIHGDILETVFSHVPLVDLVSASHVSKSWCGTVLSSLRHQNQPKPWLILRTQSTRHPYATTTHAYDPRSHIWIRISQPPIKYVSALRSSHSNFLYMLSPSKFAFSFDPLNFNWFHVDPPMVWRTDPIVARVGDAVVIAGGGCDFEDDPFAVEIYNLKMKAWELCDSMPGSLRDSAASSWLSVAATDEKLIVTDRLSGVTHWFDPEDKSWSDSIFLDPGLPITGYNIGCSNLGIILVGVCRTGDVERVKVWRVGAEDFRCEEIGEMPPEYLQRLKSESFDSCSINVRVSGNTAYMYNTWDAEEVVACELIDGEGCRWWSVGNVVAREGMIADLLVVSCSEVGLNELQRVMETKDWIFES